MIFPGALGTIKEGEVFSEGHFAQLKVFKTTVASYFYKVKLNILFTKSVSHFCSQLRPTFSDVLNIILFYYFIIILLFIFVNENLEFLIVWYDPSIKMMMRNSS